MKYTLDTNCIIDLEEERADAVYLRKLVSIHRNHDIELSVVAISASENQKGGKSSKTFDEFLLKLSAADLEDVNMLLPMAYWDVAYWDHAVPGDAPGAEELEEKVHDILFPGTPIENPQQEKYSERKWRNNKCDVQITWARIYHGNGVLVTRDENFHKNAEALRNIGLKNVIRPSEI
jgi:hypothetical protein